MNALTKYEAARNAVQECATVDEAKGIADKAEAMRVYARQAHDSEMEIWVAEIRLRALRRLGEISKTLEKASAANLPNVTPVSHREKRETLKDAGVHYRAANRYEQIADIPEAEFEEFIAEKKAAGQPVTAKDAINKVSKAHKRQEKAQKLKLEAEALPLTRYPVIYADPPWSFKTHSTNGMDRAADNHYPTMDLDQILELQPPCLDDCVLFLWATVPMLQEALEVMDVWGFEYKSQMVWVKDRIGTGYWTRNKHEILLIGTRGRPLTPEPSTVPESAILAPVGKHSAKPEEFRRAIDRIYGDLPKLEMFARTQAKGWDTWGYEAPKKPADKPQKETGFEEWWRMYPRRTAKGEARKAYVKALSKTTEAQLWTGLEKMVQAAPWGNDLGFCPHPATWLNQERWNDEYQTPGQNIDAQILEAAREADRREANGQ